MNLKQLEVFVAVAETGSFTRGAERSFLTQSTVSQHISSLENEFGIKLLDRTGKGAFLTEAGRIFLDYSRQILSGTQEMTTAIRRFKGLEHGALKIGGSNIPACYVIPHFMTFFQKLYPGIKLHLTQADSSDIIEKLKQGSIELGLVGRSYADDMIHFRPVGTDRITLVVYPSHKWRSKQEISIAEVEDETFIFREEGSGTYSTVQMMLLNAGLNPENLRVMAHLGSNEAIKQAVCNGNGISFLSELSVSKECQRGELYTVKIKGLTISRKFYLAFRRGRELSPAGKTFFKHLVEWMEKFPDLDQKEKARI